MRRFFLHILIVAILATGSLFSAGSSKMPASSQAKLQVSNEYVKNGNSILNIKNIDYPYSLQEGRLYIDMLILLNSHSGVAELKKMGCKVTSEIGDLVAISAPADKVNSILALESVKAAEVSQLRNISTNMSVEAINAREVKVDNELTPTGIIGGEGVIVGVFDTGIDVTHPDFIGENGSRVLKLWDMSDNSGVAPDGFGFGTEYIKDDIDNNLGDVSQKDINGHGTHVAGTAAGNGSADDNYRGVAYNSDLIIVKGTTKEDNSSFSDNNIIAGCQYIFEEAERLGRPAVINLSLGTPVGSHDGKGLLAYALSSLTGKGKIIVASAGNNGEMPIYAGGEIAKDETVEFPIFPQNLCELFENFCPEIPGFYLTAADVWHTPGAFDEFTLGVYALTEMGFVLYHKENFNINTPTENKMILDNENNPLGLVSYYSVPEFPTNGDGNFLIQIHNGGVQAIPVEEFVWSLTFTMKQDSRIDLWAGIPLPGIFPFAPQIGTRYFTGSNNMTIGSPGDGDSIVSVASYVSKNSWVDKNQNQQVREWTVGGISSFSSLGPRRDGRIAPIVGAPGQVIFAAKSKDYMASENSVLEGGLLTGMNGTSMSAPHVAGAIALMLQVNPELQFSDILNILENTSLKDGYTGNENNNVFGYGKINVQAAIDFVLASSSVKYIYANDVKVYPNPTTDFITLELAEYIENPEIKLYTTSGEQVALNFDYQVVANGNHSNILLNVSNLPTGIYNANCVYGNKVAKFRFVVTRK